jgi:hypothetical protein
MKMNMNIGSESEGTYGGYTASIQDFATSRRAGMERAIVFAKEEKALKELEEVNE